MSRRIWTGTPASRVGLADDRPQLATQMLPEEDFLGRLLKYIPAEIVGLYLAARGVVPTKSGADDDATTVLWIIAAACWLLVPIYMWVATTRNGQKPLLVQIALATVAFPVWVFAIAGAPVSSLTWSNTHQYIGSVALVFTTFIFGLVKPPGGV
jgi:hypothetical protein